MREFGNTEIYRGCYRHDCAVAVALNATHATNPSSISLTDLGRKETGRVHQRRLLAPPFFRPRIPLHHSPQLIPPSLSRSLAHIHALSLSFSNFSPSVSSSALSSVCPFSLSLFSRRSLLQFLLISLPTDTPPLMNSRFTRRFNDLKIRDRHGDDPFPLLTESVTLLSAGGRLAFTKESKTVG